MTRKALFIFGVALPFIMVTTSAMGSITAVADYFDPLMGEYQRNYHASVPAAAEGSHEFTASTPLPLTDTVSNGVSVTSLLTVGANGMTMVDTHKGTSGHIESNACIQFTIDTPSAYVLSGTYSITAKTADWYTVCQAVWLYDAETYETLYSEADMKRVKGNAVWNVGVDNSGSGILGNLRGLLSDPTHVYGLYWAVGIGKGLETFDVTAQSTMRFDIVPAPGAALLGFIGLGLVARARKWAAAC